MTVSAMDAPLQAKITIETSPTIHVMDLRITILHLFPVMNENTGPILSWRILQKKQTSLLVNSVERAIECIIPELRKDLIGGSEIFTPIEFKRIMVAIEMLFRLDKKFPAVQTIDSHWLCPSLYLHQIQLLDIHFTTTRGRG